MRLQMLVLAMAILALVVLPYVLVSLALPSTSPGRRPGEFQMGFSDRDAFLTARRPDAAAEVLQPGTLEEARAFEGLEPIPFHPPFVRALALAVSLLFLGVATGGFVLLLGLILGKP